jgi:hypothetical protein
MKSLLQLLLLITLFQVGTVFAESAVKPVDNTSATAITALQACPRQASQRIDLAQVSQSDCCKGHKGVCGCRAGKIVCCDNSVSPNCTCHADSGVTD